MTTQYCVDVLLGYIFGSIHPFMIVDMYISYTPIEVLSLVLIALMRIFFWEYVYVTYENIYKQNRQRLWNSDAMWFPCSKH